MSDRRAAAQAERRRRTFRRTAKPIDPRNRVFVLLAVFLVIGAGFVALLVERQTPRADHFRSLGVDQRTAIRELAAPRGTIFDRNGFVLASATPSHRVVADPSLIADPAAAAALLAPLLGLDEIELTGQLTATSANDRYRLLARDVDDATADAIERLAEADDTGDALVGVFDVPDQDRVYPAEGLAESVIGRVDPDEVGIFGVEKQYGDQMTGTPGLERYERGRFGSISVAEREVEPAIPGQDVVLTIDNRIQYVAEQSLLDHCRTSGAQGLTAVMTEPSSGEILAMASVVRDDDDQCVVPGYNTAVVNTFEPGSVMKTIVMAAASERLGYTADTTVEVPPRMSVGGKVFVDHPDHATGMFSLNDILAHSMNVGTILVSQAVGAEGLYDTMIDFGISRLTGLDIEGESAGSLRAPDDWWGADYGSIPIGQGVTVNAAQLASVYSTIANDGVRQPLTLVRELRRPDGSVVKPRSGETTTVVSPATAGHVTNELTQVVERGTGKPAAIDGYRVAGKTGTAWKVFDDGTGTLTYGEAGERRYVLSFAGFLPADDPAVALVVVVDEPVGTGYQNETTASEQAAPVFADIASYAVRLLGLPPEAGVAVDPGVRVRGTPATVPDAGSRSPAEAALGDGTEPAGTPAGDQAMAAGGADR
ncbi:MAG: peptidoglycan D,D-transpeptidase FtsI family protein [Acidimicrobiales bacterium]